MPGIYQFSPGEAAEEAKRIYDRGIPYVLLFGIPEKKDEIASCAYDPQGVAQRAIAGIKRAVPRLKVIGDVCMCEYTSHGHCGIIRGQRTEARGQKNNPASALRLPPSDFIDNDKTIEILARIAVSYARAGVDMVAPSAMMDRQVGVIKQALLKHNYPQVKIMGYSAKYASDLYGPFRQAAESPPAFADRRSYQMDYHNSREAVVEARLDIEEGADIIMVKPAWGYQDIIYRLKRELGFPLACYSVSGEYAMIKSAASRGWLDEKKVVLEALTGFKRAGADLIITYYALQAATWLKTQQTQQTQ